MTNTRLPSLAALRAFEAVARIGSMKEASNELHVTPGAISQLIRKLEDELSIKLFRRKNREITLTDEGRQLRDSAHSAFNMLKQTVNQLSIQDKKQQIIIACEPALTNNWLVPRLSQIMAMQPEADIKIVAIREADSRLQSCDLVITTQLVEDSLFQFDYCGNETFSAVAAPTYINSKLITKSSTLSAATFLTVQYNDKQHLPSWNDWREESKIPNQKIKHEIDFGEEIDQAIHAARSGAGILLVPNALISDDVKSGKLSTINSVSLTSSACYWVGRSVTGNEMPQLSTIHQWLSSELKSTLSTSINIEQAPIQGNVYAFRSNSIQS